MPIKLVLGVEARKRHSRLTRQDSERQELSYRSDHAPDTPGARSSFPEKNQDEEDRSHLIRAAGYLRRRSRGLGPDVQGVRRAAGCLHEAPRELLWWLGVIIFLLMMATAFFGYTLPWGQMSFWGATVITNLFSAIPVVGDSVVTWLWGGFTVGDPTLNRFYALHYLLPFVIVAVVGLHLVALHRFGSSNPIGIDTKHAGDTIPFHPYYTVKDLLGLVVFFLVSGWFVFYEPNALLNPDNYIPANPGQTPAHIVPEWYLLPYYVILRSIPNKLLGVIAMLTSILVLFALPWLDTSPVRSGRFRPMFKVFYWVLVADCVLLTYAGGQPPEGTWLIMSRIGAAYYFAHFFVVLPFVARVERPRPLPMSIRQAVLPATGSAKP